MFLANLTIEDLGLLEYGQAWKIQKKLVQERMERLRPDTLLLVEHPPVYTRGSSARRQSMTPLPFPIYDVERGGGITYHGPGQLVGYPIIHLGERQLKVGTYLRCLESILVSTLKRLSVAAGRKQGFTGVWCGEQKISSIGVAVRGWVSFHGFALNVDCELKHFNPIKPCGLNPEQMTSLRHILNRPIHLEEVRPMVQEAFLTHFELTQCTSLVTDQPRGTFTVPGSGSKGDRPG